MEDCTLLILDPGLNPAEIAAAAGCCKVGPGPTVIEED